MLERELARLSRAVRAAVGSAGSGAAITAARRHPGRASTPSQGAPALTDALLWGIGRWGTGTWGPEDTAVQATGLGGRWAVGRWGYMFWRRPRVRVRA